MLVSTTEFLHIGQSAMPKTKSRAGPKPYGSDPNANLLIGSPIIEVQCKRKDTLLQFKRLISKVSYEEEGLSKDEFFITWELFLRLTRMAERDYNFLKWLIPLKEISPLMGSLKPGLSRRNGLKKAFWSIGEAGKWLILSPHEYFGIKYQEPEGRVKLRRLYPEKRRPPLERYIGVGYKDKGFLPNLAVEGSPSWKVVCQSEGQRSQKERTEYLYSDGPPLGIPYPRNERGPSARGRNPLRSFQISSGTVLIRLNTIEENGQQWQSSPSGTIIL